MVSFIAGLVVILTVLGLHEFAVIIFEIRSGVCQQSPEMDFGEEKTELISPPCIDFFFFFPLFARSGEGWGGGGL